MVDGHEGVHGVDRPRMGGEGALVQRRVDRLDAEGVGAVDERRWGVKLPGQIVNEPPSTWHRNTAVESLSVNANVGVVSALGSDGALVISGGAGGVASTVQEAVAAEAFPTLSVARTPKLCGPSASPE